jgi:predicted site-specific integrase-resolvase
MARPTPLLNTSEAARAIGIHPRTLTKYVTQGKVRPTLRLPSGQMRWDIDELKAQLRALDADRPDD